MDNGKQAEKNGVQIGSRIVAVDDTVIDAKNFEQLKKKITEGRSQKIRFQQKVNISS